MKVTKVLRDMCQGRERGFTLIELLVVIGILAVLAAVAVPFLAEFIGAGAEEAAAAELSTVQAAAAAATARGHGEMVPVYPKRILEATPGVGGNNTIERFLLETTVHEYSITIHGIVTQYPIP